MCKVCELAKGKFILLLSDEDLVDFNVLDKILNIINKNKNKLSVLRTSGDKQAMVPSTKFAKPGEDALFTYMLTSNYMSGVMFNNKILRKYNGINYIMENLKNSVCLYYPHMVLELMLFQYGYVYGTNMILIYEGRTEKSDEPKDKIDKNIQLNHYATFESRLEQHKGFLDIFKDLDICKSNFMTFRKMYIKLCLKTIFLVSLSINIFYKKTDKDILNILYRTYKFCIYYLNEIYKSKTDNYKKYYYNDLEIIKQIYNSYIIKVK
jgi:hypothetical protein